MLHEDVSHLVSRRHVTNKQFIAEDFVKNEV